MYVYTVCVSLTHTNLFPSPLIRTPHTQVPDVYDMIRYDILHNYHCPLTGIQDKELYEKARVLENVRTRVYYMALMLHLCLCFTTPRPTLSLTLSLTRTHTHTHTQICVPHEYGKDSVQKSVVGSKVCGALLEKIKYDLRVSRSSTTQDMRFLLDHSHADDLEINSLGTCISIYALMYIIYIFMCVLGVYVCFSPMHLHLHLNLYSHSHSHLPSSL